MVLHGDFHGDVHGDFHDDYLRNGYEDNGYEWKYGGVLKGGYPQ